MRPTLWLSLIAIVGGCISPTGERIDVHGLAMIPAVDSLAFASIEPAASWDYWELRFTMRGAEDRVVGSGGALSRSALSPHVISQLDALAPQSAFGIGCLPGDCFSFIAAVRNDEVTTVLSTQALRVFLGALDTIDEAALLVHALGFYWLPDTEVTGYRALSAGGWEFVVLELVALCAPVQTDRVLLRVDPTGSVSERARAVWQRQAGVCI